MTDNSSVPASERKKKKKEKNKREMEGKGEGEGKGLSHDSINIVDGIFLN